MKIKKHNKKNTKRIEKRKKKSIPDYLSYTQQMMIAFGPDYRKMI